MTLPGGRTLTHASTLASIRDAPAAPGRISAIALSSGGRHWEADLRRDPLVVGWARHSCGCAPRDGTVLDRSRWNEQTVRQVRLRQYRTSLHARDRKGETRRWSSCCPGSSQQKNANGPAQIYARVVASPQDKKRRKPWTNREAGSSPRSRAKELPRDISGRPSSSLHRVIDFFFAKRAGKHRSLGGGGASHGFRLAPGGGGHSSVLTATRLTEKPPRYGRVVMNVRRALWDSLPTCGRFRCRVRKRSGHGPIRSSGGLCELSKCPEAPSRDRARARDAPEAQNVRTFPVFFRDALFPMRGPLRGCKRDSENRGAD